jgi:hypothetical protein
LKVKDCDLNQERYAVDFTNNLLLFLLVTLNFLDGLNSELMNLVSALRMVSFLIIENSFLVKLNLLLQIHLKLLRVIIEHIQAEHF